MNLECKIALIRWLSQQYSKHLRFLTLAREQEREEWDSEVPLSGFSREDAVPNRWEEMLAAYRHRNGRASVPENARIQMRYRFPKSYKQVHDS